MHSFVTIESFDSLIHKYDSFFFDVWGIVYDGNAVFPEFISILSKLRQHNKTVRFLSNSPRRSTVAQQRLQSCGLAIPLDNIITSGEYFATLVMKDDYVGKKFFVVGNDLTVLEGFNISTTEFADTADYILISLCEQTQELGRWHSVMQEAISKGIPAICVNPDLEVFQGNIKFYTPGSFARQYEKMGGEVFYFGKPYKGIYDYALSTIDKNTKILAVGDSVLTDIKGAHGADLDSLLVLGHGIHKDIKITDKMQVLSLCQKNKCYPKYIMSKLS